MPANKVHLSRFGRRHGRRRLCVEALEPRLLLAGDTYLINFQFDEATTPTRYQRDVGAVFGDRGNGLSYGWSSDHTDQARERNLVPDQRYDTLIHFEAGASWQIALPNGLYEVTVAIGDPNNNDGLHTINVEGVNYWTALPDTDGSFIQTQQITVSDGMLTIDQGTAAHKATRIDFVHIVNLPIGPNSVPATPTITEPVVAGQVVNPADVHMEAVGFSDPDSDSHKSTDWEIWTVGPIAEPVWQTLGIQGVERLHTHLGDGIFINAQAGETSLAQNSDYELRVRFRDDTGSISAYAIRAFHTGPASAVFSLELKDVASSPAVTWENVLATPISLPSGTPSSPELRIESGSTGSVLLSIEGTISPGNLISHFPALAEHAEVRVVIEAGSTNVMLNESDLTVHDEHGAAHTIFLPAIHLLAGQRIDFWVSTNGSTYFGAAPQTTPDFSNLARLANDVAVPFVAMQPGYVVEEVSTDYRLPVNIAFVPNPGPNPDDPLYYVTELYGSIQVVTRDGTKHTFATGLLDYNPQGPISGSGEQGLTGIAVQRDAVNPEIYHLYVGMLWDNGAPAGGASHYPKVERIDSVAGGLSIATRTVLLNMQPETQGQSHQISNISIGPDGKLYVHNGDGFDASTAQNFDSFRGKILRMNLDGTAPSDNPFYNAANGINARDYVFAYGVRNPFGGAWRAADDKLYEVENGPSIDRLAQINRGVNYGWNGTNASMTTHAIYNWNPSHAPVNLTFIQQSTFAGSQFPADKMDHLYVSESGPTYAPGAQANGKRIVEFVLDANGNHVSGPTTLVEYMSTGRSTVVGLAAGPDGLYFTELYEESGVTGPTAVGARVFRVRYVNPLQGDYDIDGVVDQHDHAAWGSALGSNLLLAGDGNQNGVIDIADYTVWRDKLGSTLGSAAVASPKLNEDESSDPHAAAFSAALDDELDALRIRTTFDGTEPLKVRSGPAAVSPLVKDQALLLLGTMAADDTERASVSLPKRTIPTGGSADRSAIDEVFAEVDLDLRDWL
ncbi:MAG: PQQ-dependent sugar dehydrogenase [Pirellulales bacterium]